MQHQTLRPNASTLRRGRRWPSVRRPDRARYHYHSRCHPASISTAITPSGNAFVRSIVLPIVLCHLAGWGDGIRFSVSTHRQLRLRTKSPFHIGRSHAVVSCHPFPTLSHFLSHLS